MNDFTDIITPPAATTTGFRGQIEATIVVSAVPAAERITFDRVTRLKHLSDSLINSSNLSVCSGVILSKVSAMTCIDLKESV